MSKIFSNTWFTSILAFIVLSSCLFHSMATNDSHWFQRSGSIIVLLGVLIAARRVIRLGKDYQNEDWNLPDETAEGKHIQY